MLSYGRNHTTQLCKTIILQLKNNKGKIANMKPETRKIDMHFKK